MENFKLQNPADSHSPTLQCMNLKTKKSWNIQFRLRKKKLIKKIPPDPEISNHILEMITITEIHRGPLVRLLLILSN